MPKSFKEQSKIEWSAPVEGYPGHERMMIGCLQRIADSNEHMAKNYVQLQNDLDRYMRWYKEEKEANQRLQNKIRSLSGWITRLKKSN